MLASIRPLALILGLASFSATATAAVLISEDFESIALGPFASPTESGGDGTDWSATLPTGWNASFVGPSGNPIEFRGWRVMDVDSWIATEGNQQRSDWTRGGVGSRGTVLVADTDAYDDGTNIDIGLFNAYVSTPTIDLSTIAPGSVIVEFDSFYRNEATQKGVLDVTFDGGATFTRLLTYDPAVLADGLVIDERVSLAVANPGTGSLSFRFGLIEGSNDWWFAIDDVRVTGDLVTPEAPVSLPSSLALLTAGLVGLT